MQRAFPKDSTSTWHNQDSNPGPPDSEVKCLPLDHNATFINFLVITLACTFIYQIFDSYEHETFAQDIALQ